MKGAVNLPINIDEWPKTRGETVRVRLDHYRGTNTIDVRVWHQAASGQLHPTKTGFTARVSHLPRLLAAIGEATEIARARGLIDDESDVVSP